MTAEYYYVTQRPDKMDFYMLHRAGCPAMPAKETLLFIGSLYDVSQALTVAQMRVGKKVKACYHCCRPRQEGEPPLPDKIQSRRHSNN
ncbi:hypothetical protein Q3V30_03775 [Erwinia pyri]|uniref:Uncharacterized protein n=1 Tax=Erwinia pyri TaxID=3062598 RepID=A0AA50HNU0_9GAMM|nr:hypothetical protein [Erwinia sp. DE2]WLS79642.1 hypothetical protein Q3V30_03775 [Erwinia sp. DE2]